MAPKYSMVTTRGFRLSAKEVELYALKVSELCGNDKVFGQHILMEHQDLRRAFIEEASNELLDYGPSNIKIKFKEGEEPQNIGLRPMSLAGLEELR